MNRLLFLISVFFLFSCRPDVHVDVVQTDGGCTDPYALNYSDLAVTDDGSCEYFVGTPYVVETPLGFPEMPIPADNPMSVEGIALGRRLFYEGLLSGDNQQSCFDCHRSIRGFGDPNRFSFGITGARGDRNPSTIINAAWQDAQFWDGRAASLEEQALGPVTNPIEMNSPSWAVVVDKLKAHDEYPALFLEAFGTADFDSSHVVKAIAQFERTFISGNSKYDQWQRGELELTESEHRGRELFFTEKADCFQCHPPPLFTDNLYHNNGLDEPPFADMGRANVTENYLDEAAFKTPTLRNIEFTAPYMHDGRFEELFMVVNHYNSGGKASHSLDPLMKHQGVGLNLSETEQEDLINFLKTLSDLDFLNNPDFFDPEL